MLILCLTLTAQVCYSDMPTKPQPNINFLSWCGARYGPGHHQNNLANNNLVYSNAHPLALQLGWEEQWVQDWKPFDTAAGILKDYQAPIDDFLEVDSSTWVEDMLGSLHDVLQPPLKTRATTAVPGIRKWEVFSGEFSWIRHGGNLKSNVCMPYSSRLVSRAPYISELPQGYLRVLVGKDEDGNKIRDYAHR